MRVFPKNVLFIGFSFFLSFFMLVFQLIGSFGWFGWWCQSKTQLCKMRRAILLSTYGDYTVDKRWLCDDVVVRWCKWAHFSFSCNISKNKLFELVTHQQARKKRNDGQVLNILVDTNLKCFSQWGFRYYG